MKRIFQDINGFLEELRDVKSVYILKNQFHPFSHPAASGKIADCPDRNSQYSGH